MGCKKEREILIDSTKYYACMTDNVFDIFKCSSGRDCYESE